MTLQDFCLQYAYPITRTSRIVRRTVLRAAKAKEGQPFEVELDGIGVQAWRDPSAKRITYNVFDAHALKAALLGSVGRQNLLTEGTFDVFITAAHFERDAILEKEAREGKLDFYDEDRLRDLERALASVGDDVARPQAPPLR